MLILDLPTIALWAAACCGLAPAEPAPPDLQVIAPAARPAIDTWPPVGRMRCPPFAKMGRTRICNASRLT
jgi:hypothetical protein